MAITLSQLQDYVDANIKQNGRNAITGNVMNYALKNTLDLLNGKQDALVSGTTIKTIGGVSLLGSGDLTVSASPAGSNKQIQFNDSGAFGGNSNLLFDKTLGFVGVGLAGGTPSARMHIKGGSGAGDLILLLTNSAGTNVLKANSLGCVWSNGVGAESGTTAFGENTLSTRTTGTSNTAFGDRAGNILTSGSANTFVGYRAGGGVLGSSMTGSNNTIIGAGAGLYLSSGIQNTFIGSNAGVSITTGNYNTIIGYNGTSYSSSLEKHIIITDGASIQGFKKDGNHNIVLGPESALATNATNGFAFIPSCAGIPTGTPGASFTGKAPIVIDSTNNKMYIYTNSAWQPLN